MSTSRCDGCGCNFYGPIPGQRYCSPACAPTFKLCRCEDPISDGEDCFKCGGSLIPADPRAKALVES